MATPKTSTPSYSAWLRARRQPRAQSTPTRIIIGGWVLADEDGDLVVTNRTTGNATILMKGT